MSASRNSVIYGLGGVQKDPSSDLQFGEFMPLISVGNFKTGDRFQVIVTDVTSPSEFWVQVADPHGNAFAKMMADMNEEYDKSDTDVSMLPVHGLQFCVVKADKLWYRAVVLGDPTSHGYIKIRYVDFGTPALVRLTDLRPLRRQWARLPMQALRSKLLQEGLDEDGTLNQAVGFSNINIVLGVPLVATVITVDTVVNTLCLDLLNQYTSYELENIVYNMSHFNLHQTAELPFNILPLWHQDCQIYLELVKINPANALQFMTMKIQELLHIAYANNTTSF